MAAQAASALDAVVHLQRRGRRREIAGIGAVVRDGDRLVVEDALTWDDGVPVRGPGWDGLAARLGRPSLVGLDDAVVAVVRGIA